MRPRRRSAPQFGRKPSARSGKPIARRGRSVAEKKPKAKAPPTKRRKPNGGATRTKAAIAKAAGQGRSYVYSEDLADRLCTLLAKGTGLRPSCKACGVDSATVLQWAT